MRKIVKRAGPAKLNGAIRWDTAPEGRQSTWASPLEPRALRMRIQPSAREGHKVRLGRHAAPMETLSNGDADIVAFVHGLVRAGHSDDTLARRWAWPLTGSCSLGV